MSDQIKSIEPFDESTKLTTKEMIDEIDKIIILFEQTYDKYIKKINCADDLSEENKVAISDWYQISRKIEHIKKEQYRINESQFNMIILIISLIICVCHNMCYVIYKLYEL